MGKGAIQVRNGVRRTLWGSGVKVITFGFDPKDRGSIPLSPVPIMHGRDEVDEVRTVGAAVGKSPSTIRIGGEWVHP